jgi:hypothetical protein
MVNNDKYFKEALEIIIEKMDLLRDKIDSQKEKIDEVEKKIDKVPEKIISNFELELGHCKEIHSLKITAMEKNCASHIEKIDSLEQKFIIGSKPYSTGQNRPESLYK